jgi:hypothetical protein
MPNSPASFAAAVSKPLIQYPSDFGTSQNPRFHHFGPCVSGTQFPAGKMHHLGHSAMPPQTTKPGSGLPKANA